MTWVKSREAIHSPKVASKKDLVLTYSKKKKKKEEDIGRKSEACLYFGHLKIWILLRDTVKVYRKNG